MGKAFVFADWLFELLKLHFLWVIYIFRGGIILGIFPSTAAMYATMRYWFMKNDGKSIYQLYKGYYKENFKVANMLGWMLAIISIIIVLNFLYIPLYPENFRLVMYAIVIFMGLILLIEWMYMFPTIVHYSFPIANYFVVILRMGFASLAGIIMQLLFLGIFLLVIYIVPALLLLFGIVPLALAQMALSYNLQTV